MNIANYMGKRLRENELGKSLGLSSGRLNAWDLPEFDTARQGILKERDLGLSDYIGKLTRSGVEGPSAALSLERYGDKYSGSLLDLARKLQGSYTDRGLALGKQAIDERRQDIQNYQQQHMARKAMPNDWTKWNQGIQQGVGTATSLAKFGLGAGAMMGFMPPGLQGTSPSSLLGASGMSSGLNGTNFMELLQQLMAMMGKK
jgi:hypothetical protein